jgi:flagellar basal-body rod protein FlgC
MPLSSAISASSTALDAQRARMEVAVSNLANAESTRGPDGEPYRRRDVVLTSAPIGQSFDSVLGSATAVGVRVVEIAVDSSPFKQRYDPSHPDADAQGYVKVPNVDVPEEMVDMLSAARAYQANLSAIGVIRDTIQKALELGR